MRLAKHRSIFPIASLLAIFFLAVANTMAQEVSAKIKSGTNFSLPEEDRVAGIFGDVQVGVDIDKEGRVKDTAIELGFGWVCGVDLDSRAKDLDRSLAKWVKGFTFEPATKDGKPVDYKLSLTFSFSPAEAKTALTGDQSQVYRKPLPLRAGVLNGKALSLPKPDYGNLARINKLSGTAYINVMVDEAGNVIWAQTVKGHPLLVQGARPSACAAKFAPMIHDGKPTRFLGTITYNFVNLR